MLHQFGVPEGVRLLPGVESSDGKEITRVELQLDRSIGVFGDDWDDRLGVIVMIAEPTLIHRDKGFLGDNLCTILHTKPTTRAKNTEGANGLDKPMQVKL